jgi:flagellar hook-associated protein 3 FlgL
MRVTENATSLASRYYLERHGTLIDKLQVELASGKKVNKDSDDPMAASEAHAITRQAAYLSMYSKNVDRADSTLNYTDTILSNITDMLYKAQQLANQAASGLLTSVQLQTASDAILDVRDEILALANTSYQGVYLFSGAQSDTKPYVYLDPEDPTNTNPDPATSYVIFQGDNNPRQVPVGNDLEVQDMVSGKEAFNTDIYPTPTPTPPTEPSNTQDIFEVLRLMAEAVKNGNIQSGDPSFDKMAPLLEEARNNVTVTRSEIGARLNLLEKVQEEITDQTDQLTIRASKLEDADVAQVVTDLTMAQTAQQATLYVQGSVMKSTLFDYIG